MQTRSDDFIRSDVLFELKWDPKIDSASDIAVAVKDGVVTLSGFVHSYWEKDASEKAAKRAMGSGAWPMILKSNPVRLEPIPRSHGMPFMSWKATSASPVTGSR